MNKALLLLGLACWAYSGFAVSQAHREYFAHTYAVSELFFEGLEYPMSYGSSGLAFWLGAAALSLAMVGSVFHITEKVVARALK